MTTKTRTPYILIQRYPKHGRTKLSIECPFCGTRVMAHEWSLHGSGKRCECGALLHGNGCVPKEE